MAEPTLVQIFGAGATQDATSLTIQKSSLATVGLTASANNTAESLIVAILLNAEAGIGEDERDANIDQNVAVSIGTSPNTTTRNNEIYLRNTISIEIDKLLPAATTIDPDDF